MTKKEMLKKLGKISITLNDLEERCNDQYNQVKQLTKRNKYLQLRLDNGERVSEIIRMLLGKDFPTDNDSLTKLFLAKID